MLELSFFGLELHVLVLTITEALGAIRRITNNWAPGEDAITVFREAKAKLKGL
jgi:hypothetical protein